MRRHLEKHRTGKAGWLRAAVLGADDGILSTASLMLGVAAAHGSRGSLLIAGLAGLVAGAMSMAAGEYVLVHSQADTEQADLALERNELRTNNEGEHQELAEIYVGRGLEPALAKQVAVQLMAHNAVEAHARDELGITESLKAHPIQAAIASAVSFSAGAAVPLIAPPSFLCRTSSFSCRRRLSYAWRLWGRWRRAPAGRVWRLEQSAPRFGAPLRWL